MTLLEMSLSGAVLVGAVVLVRALILHRLPKGTLLLLWWLALARFLLPFSIPSPVSAYALLVTRTAVVSETATALFPAAGVYAAPAAVMQAAAVPEQPSIPTLPLVWALGTAGFALFFAAAAVRCGREFRSSLPVTQKTVQEWLDANPLRRRVQVRTSDRIAAPLTYGILRPVILLPEGFDFADSGLAGYVLTHEWVHIRRLDGLTKLLIIAAACLHWWNPMAWVLYVLFNRDLELSCDEAVVRRYGVGSRGGYARALIRMEECKSGLAPFCSSFNRNAMEERILAIMKLKKMTVRAAAASAATVFAVGLLFATSAQAAVPAVSADSGETTDWYAPSEVDWKEERELLEGFEPFGISYDDNGKMYFNGERVRWFWDGYEIWEDDGHLLGWSMRYEYLDREGTVDVRTLHSRKDNGDGSWDGYGPLIDIVAYSQEEFDAHTYEELRERGRVTAVTDDAVLVEDPARSGTADGLVEDSAAFSEETGVFTSEIEDELFQVVEDEVQAGEAAGTAAVQEATYAAGNSTAPGRTLEEIFAGFAPYGVTYRETDGSREVFYNGELAAQFVDIKPDGGTFSFSSTGGDASTLTIRTAYDKNGRLTGVVPDRKPASQSE